MCVAEKHQIRAPGEIRIRHDAAVLADHGEGTANLRGTESRVPGHDGINHATEGSEAKRKANDNVKKLGGSLLLGTLLPGSLLLNMLHAAKIIKMSGERQCQTVKKLIRHAEPILKVHVEARCPAPSCQSMRPTL